MTQPDDPIVSELDIELAALTMRLAKLEERLARLEAFNRPIGGQKYEAPKWTGPQYGDSLNGTL